MHSEMQRPARRLEFSCAGTQGPKARVELDARMRGPAPTQFVFACDEGPTLGGDGSAPTPLHLFVGALTGCLMTQMRNFARRLGVTLDSLEVEVRANWQFVPDGRLYETRPDGIEVDVNIASPNTEAEVAELIRAARRGCFIEQTLSVPNTIRHRMKTATGWTAL